MFTSFLLSMMDPGNSERTTRKEIQLGRPDARMLPESDPQVFETSLLPRMESRLAKGSSNFILHLRLRGRVTPPPLPTIKKKKKEIPLKNSDWLRIRSKPPMKGNVLPRSEE